MGESLSSSICAVVKRPDHHCGDDTVVSIRFYIYLVNAQVYLAHKVLQEQEATTEHLVPPELLVRQVARVREATLVQLELQELPEKLDQPERLVSQVR